MGGKDVGGGRTEERGTEAVLGGRMETAEGSMRVEVDAVGVAVDAGSTEIAERGSTVDAGSTAEAEAAQLDGCTETVFTDTAGRDEAGVVPEAGVGLARVGNGLKGSIRAPGGASTDPASTAPGCGAPGCGAAPADPDGASTVAP